MRVLLGRAPREAQPTFLALLVLALAGIARAAPFTLGNTKHGWVELLSWQPRAFLFHGFLSDAECDHVIATAAPQLERSYVVGPDGKEKLDDIRTSYGTFLRKRLDPILSTIEDRMAAATHLHTSHHEDLQVLKYEHGQTYRDHYDINDTPERLKLMRESGVRGGLRTATLLVYLSDVEEGGETAFPYGRWLDAAAQAAPPYTKCAARGTAVKPKRGDAVLFFSLKPNVPPSGYTWSPLSQRRQRRPPAPASMRGANAGSGRWAASARGTRVT
ncbi:putative prolyl 4-hydroxylase 4 isoform A [Micractinium conductrix]|uniref:Prolyl 4-hydroxylase 4 isoform A n=1 Tax=Micractinium conductrix TaxID=554055 RepID=A0A2P6VM04_9CHLO|nr:putative prolyl 4-hydroxylase 4 isoform A [Micractinium conductrix]|eukprot:PSC75136.1 putative prolyl 4-hydroxylase 4 isoform A [Micractinium conductrix]